MATNHPNDRSPGLPKGRTAGFTHEILADGLLLRIGPHGWSIFAPGTTDKAVRDLKGHATYILSGRGEPTQDHRERARKIWRACTSTAAELSDALDIPANGPTLWIEPAWSVIDAPNAKREATAYWWSFYPPESTAIAIASGKVRRFTHGTGLPTRADYQRAAASWHVIALTRHVDQSSSVRIHRAGGSPGDSSFSVWWHHNTRFVRGYIAGMFPKRRKLSWANPTCKNSSRGYRDIAGDTLDEITADCERFLAALSAPNDGDTVDGGLTFWKERRRGAWHDAGFPPIAAYVDDRGQVRLREITPPGRKSRFETSTVKIGEHLLVLCIRHCGWTVYAPGTSDEAIAAGKASCVLGGRGRPTEADHERVREFWKEQVLTVHFDTRDACMFQRSGPWFMGIFGHGISVFQWRELKPFVRGYTAAMFGSGLSWEPTDRGAAWPRGFRHIRRSLDKITADCERFLAKREDPDARNTLECGVDFWNQRSRGLWRDRGFPPVAPYVDNVGYVCLRRTRRTVKPEPDDDRHQGAGAASGDT